MVVESHGNVSFGKKKKTQFCSYINPKKKSLTLLKHLQTNPLTQNIQENVQTPEIKPI
jgi:hypothetical protein